MNLDIRKRILLIAGVVLLLLLLLIGFLFFRRRPAPVVTPPQNQEQVPQEETTPPPTTLELPPPPPPSTPEGKQKLYVVQLSKIFMERYGSYSNQNEGKNISDVKDLTTEKFYNYIESKKEQYNSEYKGTSTKVISTSIQSFEKETAVVTIGIQQFQEEQGKAPLTTYRTGKINLVKADGGWKIDGLFWDTE